MSRVNEQLVQLAYIPATEAVVVAHEDLQRIAGGRKAQGCCEHRGEGRNTHLGQAETELRIQLRHK